MIIILREARFDPHNAAIKSALENRFPGVEIALQDPAAPPAWPGLPAWDDVLVVPFDAAPLSAAAIAFVSTALRRAPSPFVLPVAVTRAGRPPVPLDAIKALPWEDDGFARGCLRIGARLGLALRKRDHRIFISYRTVDGAAVAVQFEEVLRREGYNVWRDESKDPVDGQTSIAPGEKVQAQIEAHLITADLVLLLDTPRAWESEWISLEVTRANGNLIPVLPVLFRQPGERVLCSRFRGLETLQRGAVLELPGRDMPARLEDSFVATVLGEMEQFLSDIYRRRLDLPHRVKSSFLADNYEWTEKDRFLYEAIKRTNGRLLHRVFSHCSHFDGVYDPALRTFVEHLRVLDPSPNYALYVYDGVVIPPAQLRQIEIQAGLADATQVVLLHHSEVLSVLKSNFVQRP
ncbi:MAG: toll/interleukin-1 receptor domain-containing protein [Candidatus Didemnitutus sp.]|nr:toll/interleukin-1 receptor domain-containing protein [Candidatus Didemnitutus sp.]